jgi:hypothetical protein
MPTSPPYLDVHRATLDVSAQHHGWKGEANYKAEPLALCGHFAPLDAASLTYPSCAAAAAAAAFHFTLFHRVAQTNFFNKE